MMSPLDDQLVGLIAENGGQLFRELAIHNASLGIVETVLIPHVARCELCGDSQPLWLHHTGEQRCERCWRVL